MIDNRQEQARRYLLGKMSEQEAVEFEAQYFVDDDLFEEMTELDDEMLDCFVRGELSKTDAQGFQKKYLTSNDRLAKAGFARLLTGHISDSAGTSSTPSRPFLHKVRSIFLPTNRNLKSFALIAATLLIFAWLAFTNLRLRQEVEHLRARQVELQRREQYLRKQVVTLGGRSEDQNKELQARQNSSGPDVPAKVPAESTIASLTLSPGTARSAGGPKILRTSANTLMVRLQLLIEHDDYSAYAASVATAERIVVWQKKVLTSQAVSGARAITIQLPSKILSNGTYLVKLTGTRAEEGAEDVGDYSFQVVKR